MKIQKYSRAESKWTKTHMRLIQEWINRETGVEQEHLRAPLCRSAAKSFCLSVRLHMKRKFPMSSPDEDSRRHGMYTFTSGVHEASLLETGYRRHRARGVARHLSTRGHTRHTLDTQIHTSMEEIQTFDIEPRKGTYNLFYEANLLTVAPLSHPGSIISQEKKFGHQRKTLIWNCPAFFLMGF